MTKRAQGAQRVPKGRSQRLRGHSYKGPRTYYVTICTEGMRCRFGRVTEGRVVLNRVGQMVRHWLEQLEVTFPHVVLDCWIIMPNHLHALIRLRQLPAPSGSVEMPSLDRVVGWFKSITTHAYGRGVRESGWRPYEKRFWQRGYYDRIVRNDAELGHFREYVRRNPIRWSERRRDDM